jgi:hypothetical protein
MDQAVDAQRRSTGVVCEVAEVRAEDDRAVEEVALNDPPSVAWGPRHVDDLEGGRRSSALPVACQQ